MIILENYMYTDLNLLHGLAFELTLQAHNGVVLGSSPSGPTINI